MQHRGDLIGLFAHHKVAANLLMIIMIMSGAFALDRLNVQFFPTFELEIVQVRVVWSGASAEDIEDGITNPLEQRLRTVDNLDKMTSTSSQGISAITMEFKEGPTRCWRWIRCAASSTSSATSRRTPRSPRCRC
jgi:multidrug efflux pump subunit AcrB